MDDQLIFWYRLLFASTETGMLTTDILTAHGFGCVLLGLLWGPARGR